MQGPEWLLCGNERQMDLGNYLLKKKGIGPVWLFDGDERHRIQGDYLVEKKGVGARVIIWWKRKAEGPRWLLGGEERHRNKGDHLVEDRNLDDYLVEKKGAGTRVMFGAKEKHRYLDNWWRKKVQGPEWLFGGEEGTGSRVIIWWRIQTLWQP